MKTIVEKRLFWFLKENAELDLSKNTCLDMYIQHILSRGRTSDVKRLLKLVDTSDFIESLSRIKKFLPQEVKRFWEEWPGNNIKEIKMILEEHKVTIEKVFKVKEISIFGYFICKGLAGG